MIHQPVKTRFPPKATDPLQCSKCLTLWPCEIEQLRQQVQTYMTTRKT
jgi:hypothetical protein